MSWYRLLWSLIVTYLCAKGFTAYMAGAPATTGAVFGFLVAFGTLELTLIALEKIVRYRLGKKGAVLEVFSMLTRHQFPTAEHRRLKAGWLPNSGAEGYFREISNWTKGWDVEHPIPEYVLLARDWVGNYDRLLRLAMSDVDIYAVDRFVEVSDEAVKRYATASSAVIE
jgi:hypothetical protein